MDHLTTLGYPPEDPQGPIEINAAIDNIYNKRYADGYKDGMSQITQGNAHIVYQRHTHVSNCYKTVGSKGTCTVTQRITNINYESGRISFEEVHSSCGLGTQHTGTSSNTIDGKYVGQTFTSTHQYDNTSTKIICGYNQNEIIGATITFK